MLDEDEAGNKHRCHDIASDQHELTTEPVQTAEWCEPSINQHESAATSCTAVD